MFEDVYKWSTCSLLCLFLFDLQHLQLLEYSNIRSSVFLWLHFHTEAEHQVRRFLRAEEEFWVWIKLNQVLIQRENTLLESLDFWTNHRK